MLTDGTVLEEATCRSNPEVTNIILNVVKTVNFSITKVIIKVGNGVPVHRELLRDLDESMPIEVQLEVVGEAEPTDHLKFIVERLGIYPPLYV